jgi:hypothetical protein
MSSSSTPKFDAHYVREIRPKLIELERMRKMLLPKVLALLGIFGALGLGLLLGFVLAGAPWIAVAAATALYGAIFAILARAFFRYLSKQFRCRFKEQIITAVLNFFETDLVFKADGCIPAPHVSNSMIFGSGSFRVAGEGLVHGRLSGVRIQASQVVVRPRTGRDGEGLAVLSGIFAIAEFNKEIKAITVVRPDISERVLGRAGKTAQSLGTMGEDLKLINLEDSRFENEFAVYGTDEVEARYILTPSMMERILAFREVTGHGLSLAFRGGHVYVSIPRSEAVFEPRVFKTVFSQRLIKRYVADMTAAIGVVEELNLTRKIWTKR